MKTTGAVYFLAVTFATFREVFAKYIFDSWDFAVFLMVMVIIDTFTGIWAAMKQNALHSSPFGKVFVKTILYAAFLVVLHGFENYGAGKISMKVFSWINSVGYAALIGREGLSVVENITKIKPDLLPKFIIKKLRDYEESGSNPSNIS